MRAKAIEKKKSRTEKNREAEPRLVYTQAPVLLGRIVERGERGWVVDLGPVRRELDADDGVDPALLEEAKEAGARVLVDASATPLIVGVVATRRALSIDADGRVAAKVRSIELSADEEIVFRIPGAFLRAKAREVEVYGERVLTRARNLAKIMAAMIKLN